MAYDKDSNIGQFKATQGQDDTGQTDLFRQNLNAMPLNQNQKNNLPLNSNQRNSLAIGQNQRNSIALNQSQRNSIAIGQNQRNSIQLSQSQMNSIPLGKDVVKIIDMLSMDQFGHNISKLRKDLSIVDARQVNSDKEYGILQLEDGLNFNNTPTEDISDGHQSVYVQRLLCSDIKGSIDGEPDNITFGSTYPLYLLPNLFYQKDVDTKHDYASIQWIGHKYSLTKIGTGDVIDATSIIGTIGDTGTTLIKQDFVTNTQIEKIRFVITNNSSEIMNISFKVEGEGGLKLKEETISPTSTKDWIAYSSDIDIDRIYDKDARIDEDQIETIIIGSQRIDIAFGATPTYGTQYIGVYNINDSGDGDLEKVGWAVEQGQTGWGECSIKLMLYREHDQSSPTSEMLFNFDKVSADNRDIYIDTVAIDTVYDFETRQIVYAEKKSLPNPTDTFTQDIIQIATNKDDVSIHFACPSVCQAYYYKDSINPVDYSAMTKYYKLYDIQEEMSIGMASRGSAKYSICIKKGNKFYSATNGDKLYLTTINVISSINVIGSSSSVFSCVVKTTNGSTFYLNFRSILEFSAGLLYNQSWHSAYFFDAYEIKDRSLVTNAVNDGVVGINGVSTESFSASQFVTNGDVYARYPGASTVHLPKDSKKLILTDTTMLGKSHLRLIGSGDYALSGLTFPMSLCLQHEKGSDFSNKTKSGRRQVSIFTVPTVSEEKYKVGETEKTTYLLKNLPLRTIDEFPSIFFNAPIGDRSIAIGKGRCVSVNGTVYQGSDLALCGDPSQILLSEIGTVYDLAGLLFVTNKEKRFTKIYSFSELGLQSVNTIEDYILCNPIKSSAGIIACGTTGIWTITEQGAIKLYHIDNIKNASLKTALDSSVIAVVDPDADAIFYNLMTSDNEQLITDDNGTLAYDLVTVERVLSAVVINQFGNVSHQPISFAITNATFVDVNANSSLLLIDLQNNVIKELIKGAMPIGTKYQISSNQNIEMYGESIVGQLIGLEIFAKGTGIIDVSVSNGLVQAIIVNSPNRYSSYKVGLSEQMSMLDYAIEISSEVKIMQRILGKVILMEKFNG